MTADPTPARTGGQCEAAFAGALGVVLGGTNVYQGKISHRGLLGDGAPPAVGDIARAITLSRLVSAAALVVASGAALLRRGSRDGSTGRDGSRLQAAR